MAMNAPGVFKAHFRFTRMHIDVDEFGRDLYFERTQRKPSHLKERAIGQLDGLNQAAVIDGPSIDGDPQANAIPACFDGGYQIPPEAQQVGRLIDG